MEKETKNGIGVLLIILFCGFCAYWIYMVFAHTSFIMYNNALNEVCTDYGYKEATDSRFVYYREYRGEKRLILIECDGEVIKNRNETIFWKDNWFEMKVVGESWCASRDKWGDCNYHKNNHSTIILH